MLCVRKIDDIQTQARELVEQRSFSGTLSTILHLVVKILCISSSSMCSIVMIAPYLDEAWST